MTANGFYTNCFSNVQPIQHFTSVNLICTDHPLDIPFADGLTCYSALKYISKADIQKHVNPLKPDVK